MKTTQPFRYRLQVATLADSPTATTCSAIVARSRGPTAENGQPIRLPSLAEYRRLRDDPETQWLFDEDGFCIAGVARAKSNPAK